MQDGKTSKEVVDTKKLQTLVYKKTPKSAGVTQESGRNFSEESCKGNKGFRINEGFSSRLLCYIFEI